MRASLHRVSAYAGRCKLTQRQGLSRIPAGQGESWESCFLTSIDILPVMLLLFGDQ